MKNSGQTTNLLSRFMLKQKCFLSFPIKALQSTPSAVRLGQIREIVGIHQGTKTILKLHRNLHAPQNLQFEFYASAIYLRPSVIHK